MEYWFWLLVNDDSNKNHIGELMKPKMNIHFEGELMNDIF